MPRRVNNSFKGQVLEALEWIKEKLKEHDEKFEHIVTNVSELAQISIKNKEKISSLWKG